MRTKCVGAVHLPMELYERLEQAALAEERDPLQQARWLLKLALLGQAPKPLAEVDFTRLTSIGSLSDPDKAA